MITLRLNNTSFISSTRLVFILSFVAILCNSFAAMANIKPTTVNIASCELLTDFCLSIPVNNIENFVVTDNDKPISNLTVCNFESTTDESEIVGTSIGVKLSGGFHTLKVVNKEDASVKIYNINITCVDDYQPSCNALNIFEGKEQTIESSKKVTAFELDIPMDELINYNITVNGSVYKGDFEATNVQNVIAYNVGDLNGTFYINNFKVNHKEFEGTFTSVQNFVRTLNKWDAEGAWRYDEASKMIFGGNANNDYAYLELTPKGLGEEMTTIAFQEAQIPVATNIFLVEKSNNIKIEKIVSGCSDSIQVKINGTDKMSTMR